MPSFDAKMLSWKPAALGTWVVPVGRMSYPHLFVPKAMPGDSPDKPKKYSMTVMFHKNTDMKPGLQIVREVAQAEFGNDPKLKIRSPLLNHADKTADEALAAEFPWIIRCASEYQPDVVFGSLEPCKAPEEVYGGRWCRIAIRPYAWSHPTGGKGVSFGLSNVMLLDHDDRLGGGRAKVEDQFEAYWGNDETSKAPEDVFKLSDAKANGKKPSAGSSIFD